MPSGFPNDYVADREKWNSQVGDNQARIAFAWGDAKSTGWGEYEIEDPIMFGISFVYRPTVAHGWYLSNENALTDGRFPRAGGGVTRWVQDHQDFYVGAYVLVTVATADPLLAAQSTNVPQEFKKNPKYKITHTFTFTGLAIKDIVP